MGKSNSYYMQLHVEALWRILENGKKQLVLYAASCRSTVYNE